MRTNGCLHRQSIKFIYILFSLAYVLNACSPTHKDSDQLHTIDLESAIENTQDLFLSQFVENVEYIPLELTPNSIVGNVQASDFYLTLKNLN